MLCRKPFMAGSIPFGCGQCKPCRINKARQKMWRQYFESLCHRENCFITLTYDKDHLPDGGNLEPEVAVKWIRSVRDAIRPVRIRYFLVGEYGERSRRPHYHLSVFGASMHSLFHGQPFQKIVQSSWSRGFVQVAEFNELTAQYVAGYIVKKLKDRFDPLMEGLVPEFARMSNRPGLGANAMRVIADQLWTLPTSDGLEDIPRSLKIGSRTVPLDRYLLQKLRQFYGFTDEYIAKIKGKATLERSLDMLTLFKNTELDASEFPTFKKAYLAEIEGKLRQVEWRAELHDSKGRKREAL